MIKVTVTEEKKEEVKRTFPRLMRHTTGDIMLAVGFTETSFMVHVLSLKNFKGILYIDKGEFEELPIGFQVTLTNE